MADIPILFSGPMVRAILEGRKTQTRRLAYKDEKPTRWWKLWEQWTKQPRIKAGERLWVREAWGCRGLGCYTRIEYRADGDQIDYHDSVDLRLRQLKGCDQPGKFRPSIHMHRWASRLTLIVTDVRVERLQDISEDDAKAEGVFSYPHRKNSIGDERRKWFPEKKGGILCDCAREAFRYLWDSLNKPPHSWDENPYVVAITFNVRKQNIDELGTGRVEVES